MQHRTRPMTALLLFTGLSVVLVSTIIPVYDSVCFLPSWERRMEFYGRSEKRGAVLCLNAPQRERHCQEREAALTRSSG